ncbi:MAG: AMIN domain-containing protein, partial [Desulfatitalea sp.]|nr:AMIN domain-containing protein [Desulfatitalea sp.]
MKLTRTKNIVAPLAGCLSAGLILMLLLSVGGCATQSSTPADVAASAPRLTTITSVTAVENNDEVRVTITADNPLTFSSLKQPDPLAVVLYFPQTRVEPENVLPPDDIAMIRGIDARTGNGQQTARVEIQLAADTVYTAVREGNDVLVRFNRVTLAAREDTPEAVTEATAEQSLPGASPMIQAVPASTGAPGVAE